MKSLTLALLFLGLLGPSYHAEAQSEPTSGPVITEPTPTPTPTPEPSPTPPSDNNFPQKTAVGIGVGYVFPADILTPNTASVRLRLAMGITLEALAVITIDTSEDTIHDIPTDTIITTTTKDSTITLAAQVRYPLATRKSFQLVVLGQPEFTFVNQSVDPDINDANNEIDTETRAFALDWGLGIDWFFRPNWSISLSAINPLLIASSTEVINENNQFTSDNDDLTVGLIFAPAISALVHLYF